jgi:formylglycine-generating enzyme required for sulfatase activity
MTRFSHAVAVVALLAIGSMSHRTPAVTIDMVAVGNPRNASDSQDGDSISPGVQSFGAVAYIFNIGKYEVTVGQYVEFLNNVDPSGANALALYNPEMASNPRGGIVVNAGAADGAKYEVKTGRHDNPVAFVSWYDAIRFANWLHNGQGHGDTESGAYTLLGGLPTPTNGDGITRNPGARWFVPGEDEWYKAAYHKNDGPTGNYWRFPTSTNEFPFSDQPPGSDAPTPANTANFRAQDFLPNGYNDGFAVPGSGDLTGNTLTEVGAYRHTVNPYGTFDQGGNVAEWIDTLVNGSRVLRGGAWSAGSDFLRAEVRPLDSGTFESEFLGFRVASIPEPDAILLAAVGVFASLARRRQRAKTWRTVTPAMLATFVMMLPVVALASDLRTVALSGQQAPGAPLGVAFGTFGSVGGNVHDFGPILNDAGRVAFGSFLVGNSVNSTNLYGIWSEGSGILNKVARTGDPAPGAPLGANFGAFGYQVYSNFLQFNDNGEVAFLASLTGGASGWGVWSGTPDELAQVACTGDSVPGAPAGTLFSNAPYYWASPALNDGGHVAFRGYIDTAFRYGIWSNRTGSLAPLGLPGAPAPGLPGVTFFNLYGPALNDAGRAAFYATIEGDGVQGLSARTIWAESSSGLQLIARSRNQAPGLLEGVLFAEFNSPVINNAGSVAFQAALASGPGGGGDTIWSNASGSLRMIARVGQPAPGAPDGMLYGGIRNWDFPLLNNAGHTVFRAELIDAAAAIHGQGIWLEREGHVQLIARTGQHAPGTPHDLTFRVFGEGSYDYDAMPYLNDADQIAFRALIYGNGVDATNDQGIWASDRTGVLQLIARSGDLLEVAPGDFRTISALRLGSGYIESIPRPANASPFNDFGQVAFTATFTDGSSGVFVSNAVAHVPADFNGDLVVDIADLAQWKGDFGVSDDSDADNDGDSDGVDFLAWQRQFDAVPAVRSSSFAVPEPGPLAAVAAALGTSRRRRGLRRQVVARPARRMNFERLEDRHMLSITVNTLLDEEDGSISDGDVSLRDAIALAPAGSTIDFHPSLFAAGPTVLPLHSQLRITTALEINGPGANWLTIDARAGDPTPDENNGDGVRLFNITDLNANNDFEAAIRGLTLTGGDVAGSGGAIYTHENLVVESCVITGNSSRRTGSVPSDGGGICSRADVGKISLTVRDSVISGNHTGGDGGAIRAIRCDVVVERTSLTSNSALIDGGAISQATGAMTLDECTLAGNTAGLSGGGLWRGFNNISTEALVIKGTTISKNIAGRDGGGLVDTGRPMTVTSSTISGNSAGRHGGGMNVSAGPTVLNSTITDNTAHTDGGGIRVAVPGYSSTIKHSVIAGNTRGAVPTPNDVTGGAALAFSLLGVDTAATTADNGGNLIGTTLAPINPLFGPLADNGGPTNTHALLPGSPAIDAGNPAFNPADPDANPATNDALTLDQRGIPFGRVVGGRIDMGAVEQQPIAPSADFNADLAIDGFDFLAWQRGFGLTSPDGAHDTGDADYDHDVDAADLAIWTETLGEPSAVAAAADAASGFLGRPPLDGEGWGGGHVRNIVQPSPHIIDAAFAMDHLLAEEAPRRTFRPRLRPSR